MLIYFLFCIIIFILCANISYKLRLVDIPNKRKIHTRPVAFTGGLAISLSYLIALKIFNFNSYELSLLLSIAFLITIVGFVDDKYNLSIGGKLSLQIIPIFYLIAFENITLIQIGDYEYFKIILNSFSLPFTLLSVLFLINAFNYFDGMDGGLGFLSISILLILYFLITDNNIRLFLIVLAIPILIFLCFNFSIFGLLKLFLGDSGSLLLGFLISFLLIYLANQELAHPISLAWSISIIVFEFISINFQRIIDKKNIFSAGKDHLHHLLLRKFESIILTNFFMISLNLILFTIGYIIFKYIGSLASLMAYIILFMVYYLLRKKFLIFS